MNTNLGPILNKTNVINFMTKIGLRLGMLVNTTPDSSMMWESWPIKLMVLQCTILTS